MVASVVLNIAIFWKRNLANQIIYFELAHLLATSLISLNHFKVESNDLTYLLINFMIFCAYYCDNAAHIIAVMMN